MSIDLKTIKTKWYAFLPRLSLLIWFAIYLLLDCVHHAPAISILSSFFWLITWGIVFTSSIKDNVESEAIEKSEQLNERDKNFRWYDKFLSRNAVEIIIYSIINLSILGFMLFSIKEYNNGLVNIINNDDYQLFYNSGNILLSISIITSHMQTIFDIQSKRNQQIIYIFSIIVGLCGVGLMGMSASYLPETY